jgi:putative hemolysin
MIAQGAASGVFKPAEQTLVGNVFRLDDIQVRAIMTPRRDIRGSTSRTRPRSTRRCCARAATRPCRSDAAASTKCWACSTPRTTSRAASTARRRCWKKPVHPATYVPESITPFQLLETLRRKRSHLALVVDEYGSIEGLVSLTDLLEAIVGDLPERVGDPEGGAVQRADGSWLLDGMLAIDRVEELLGDDIRLQQEDADYHTLGGLVMHQLGRVPEVGAIVELPGVKLEVVDMDANRVDRILLSRTAPPAVAADFDC